MKRYVRPVILILACATLAVVGRLRVAIYLHNRGCGYFEAGHFDQAVAFFRHALLIDPSLAEAHYMLGRGYEAKDQWAQAMDSYIRSKQADPRYLEAYKALSDVYVHEKRYHEALDVLREAQKAAPDDPSFRSYLESAALFASLDCFEYAQAAFAKNDIEEAYRWIEMASQLHPRLALVYSTWASFDMSLFRYDDAERRLKQALAIDGDFFPARRLLGDLYARQGSYDKALKEYEKALESHPGDTRLLNNMGVFLNRLERPGEASVYLQKAALLAPDDLGIRYSLASNYRDNKEWDRAVEEFRKIIAVDDEYPNIYNDLGDIYQLQGRGEEALEAFRREAALGAERLKSRPGDPRVLNDLAFALNRLGRASEAEVLIRRALKERPDYRQAYLTLAQIYENQQRHEEALAAMDKAKDLFGEAGFISENVQRIERGRSPEKK